MPKITGAELLVRALKVNGVKQVFALPGVSILSVFDACLTEGITIIGGRHEAAVVHTAEGWSRINREPSVVLVTEGPGHANAVAAIATAYAELSPVLLLSGIDSTYDLGKGAVQELPQVAMCVPVTKWSALLSDITRVPEYIATAFRMMQTGVPGPVHISLPANILEQTVEESSIPVLDPSSYSPTCASGADSRFVKDAIELLAKAKHPVILAGTTAYWSAADQALKGLVETTKIPLFTVEGARGLVSDSHPYCFGDGWSSVNPVARKMAEADVVMVVGQKIDAWLNYGFAFGKAKIIHIYPEPSEVGKNKAVELGVACNPRVAIEQLLQMAKDRKWPERKTWLEALLEGKRQKTENLKQLALSVESPLRYFEQFEEFVDDNTILLFEGGEFAAWARSYFRARRPGGWQLSSNVGHLGAGLPYALGAKLANPNSNVILFSGDGSIGFHIMELDTAVRHKIPVVVVVGNDAAWGIEEFVQANMYGPQRIVATKLCNVRWDKLAISIGAWGERVSRPDRLKPALERAFASGQPACLDLTIHTVPSPVVKSFVKRLQRRRAQARGTVEAKL